MNNDNIKLLFGLKIKQLRIENKLSLLEVANKSGLSVSYLNEIEKGKKYPKSDKIVALAETFGIDYDSLVSLKLNSNLAPIVNMLNSNFLKDFPLEVFGINPAALIDLMSETPTKLSAFVNTIIEIGRSYNMTVEDFYAAVLRSYQEMNANYFPEIEERIETFLCENGIEQDQILDEAFLIDFLDEKYGLKIQYFDEKSHPKLGSLRSVYLAKRKIIMLNALISADQRVFTLGREVAFQSMGVKIRPLTSSWVNFENFEQIFNNFKASYFSVGILIQKQHLELKLNEFFSKTAFIAEDLNQISEYFKATPETLFHQMANVLTQKFGVEDLFFLRFDNNINQELYYLTKEIHLSKQYAPNGIVDEHYCRRWLSIDILKELKFQQNEKLYEKPLAGLQHSTFYNTDNEYFVFSMARPLNIVKDVNVSVSIGFKLNDAIRNKIKFVNDPSIIKKIVNRTCERCAIFDCRDRVASPRILQKRRKNEELRQLITDLTQ